jgi:mannan endo-1,6-alpha-mannosidase
MIMYVLCPLLLSTSKLPTLESFPQLTHGQAKGADREKWKTRITGLLTTLQKKFYPTVSPSGAPLSPNIMVEISCEFAKSCNPDQTSFKAYLTRWLAATIQLAPFTRDIIMPKLVASAAGAAQQCSGGDTGTKCGRDWNSGAWDGFTGVGEQMSALAAVQANLIDKGKKAVTGGSGGTSKGDPNAGLNRNSQPTFAAVTQGSRSAAGFLTALLVMGTLGGAWWMIDDG